MRYPCLLSTPARRSNEQELKSSRNNLMWRSHLHAAPPNAPLFYGPFATDPGLYTEQILEGFDAWMGVEQILTAPQLFESGLTREVYFPKASPTTTRTMWSRSTSLWQRGGSSHSGRESFMSSCPSGITEKCGMPIRRRGRRGMPGCSSYRMSLLKIKMPQLDL